MENKDKEKAIVSEICSGISKRADVFSKALDEKDFLVMSQMFIMEQSEHFKLIADVVDDEDLKMKLLSYSTFIGMKLDDAVKQLDFYSSNRRLEKY